MNIQNIIIIILSYGLGCFNTGYYYIRFFYRQDIREVGTNVTGAYNVSRLGGRRGFIITFLGDALKGALIITLCRILEVENIITLISMLLVIAGHIFPFQLRFKGGKGLSTAFGAFLAFYPVLILFWLGTSLILLPLVRRYTVTCLFALMLLPLEIFIAGSSLVTVLFFVLYAALIGFACRDNIKEYITLRAYEGLK